MKKFLLLLFLCQKTLAANYIPLSTGIQLYDVEVLVFARHLAQADSSLFNNRETVDLNEVNAMFPVEDMPWLIEEQNTDEDKQWQVPLEGDHTTHAKALAWFAFNSPPSENPVYQRINKHPDMHALFYQKWRQPATPYRNPGYVKISNWPDDLIDPELEEEESNDSTIVGNLFETTEELETESPEDAIMPDFTMRGKVAFSKQRFQHGHVQVNLYRNSSDGETLLYLIDQNTQIDLDKWQYYDHPQFGVMMKVSLATDFDTPEHENLTE